MNHLFSNDLRLYFDVKHQQSLAELPSGIRSVKRRRFSFSAVFLSLHAFRFLFLWSFSLFVLTTTRAETTERTGVDTIERWEAVSPPVTPSVIIAITTGSSTICTGTNVTFTATPTNGGTSPTYQWKKGSTNVGTGVSYTTTDLANGDVISCVMTSNDPNALPTTAISMGLTMTVNLPTITSVSNQTVNGGSPTTGTAFIGTGATSYTWTNNNTATGLAATGTGNIVAFIATNNTTSPITSTVTVTPVRAASPSYAYIGGNPFIVLNTSTNTVEKTLDIAGSGVAVSPDGSRVYVTNSTSNYVSVINTKTNTVVINATV